jgi:hypothetical protein
MTDAVAGDAVSPMPDVDPDDPATHAEAQSGAEVQASEEDLGVRMADGPADGADGAGGAGD